MDITEINNLIYAAATVITVTMDQSSKRWKNRKHENFWKIRMQRQINNWRKEVSILTETGTGSDNRKLNCKERKIFKKYTADRNTEAENATKSLKIQKIWKKGNPIYR